MKKPQNKIGWCDGTLNPIKGLCKMNCEWHGIPCYATSYHKRFPDRQKIELRLDVFDKLDNIDPAVWFVSSTHEIFGDWIEDKWIDCILASCLDHSEHTFLFLTKNPKRAVTYPFPNNCWLGVSMTTIFEMWRYSTLQDKVLVSDANHTFVSLEPLLGMFQKGNFDWFGFHPEWIVAGALSQGHRPVKKYLPSPLWISELVRMCSDWKIPLYLKNNLLIQERPRFQKDKNASKKPSYLVEKYKVEKEVMNRDNL